MTTSRPGMKASMSFESELRARFGERVGRDAPLAPLTTFRTGGPADWLVDAMSSEDLLAAIRLAASHDIPLTLIGGGSNVLIGDRGIRGLVVRARHGAIVAEAPERVRADAGVTINGLVRWTVARGLAGLEAWAGTPGTVGGGVYGNAHFQGRLLGELVESARLATRRGEVYDVPARDLAFGYDASRLQETGEVLVSALFRVSAGADPAALRAIARASLAYRKETQPLHMPSAGCVFRNPDLLRDGVPAGVPASAGALVDRAGLKGVAVGAARVSPVHANFIVNEGGATSRDICALVERCARTVADRFGVELREEIVRLGEFGEPGPPDQPGAENWKPGSGDREPRTDRN
jgi:UDP-N-acetylmuramate dehydrogenase